MVDLIPHIADLLSSITGLQIEVAYRDTNVTFPLAVISTIGNSAETAGAAEMLSRVSVQIDCYDLSKKGAVDTAKAVDEIMTANGFKRGITQPFTEGALERYMAQYSATIDYTHENILI